jgi:hypothetical protein
LAVLVGKDQRVGVLLRAVDVHSEPLEHRLQARGGDRDVPRPAALRRLASKHDDASIQIDVPEAQGEH